MTWVEIILWSLSAGVIAFVVCREARIVMASRRVVTMSFEDAMRLPCPLVLPDCQIGDPVIAPEMVGHVMNTAAALQIIREREGC